MSIAKHNKINQDKGKIKLQGTLSFELDCEFISHPIDQCKNKLLTTQVKCHQLDDQGVIFTHQPDLTLPNCPSVIDGNPIIDYLLYHSDKVEPFEYDYSITGFYNYRNDPNLPKDDRSIIIELWGFFLCADLTKGFQDKMHKFIHKCVGGVYENEGILIEHARHLKSEHHKTIKTPSGAIPYTAPYIPTPMFINGKMVLLKLRDISAMVGGGSYADTGIVTGTNLEDKGSLDEYKTNMEQAMIDKPDIFINYSLGDLRCKEMYENWSLIIGKVCKELGIDEIEPSFTIGSTVHKIMLDYFKEKIGLNKTDLKKHGFNNASSEVLKHTKDRTSQFLAKVNGGRCHNNRPKKVSHKGRVADIDISGCYASTMESLIYPVGNPLIIDYPKSRNSSKENINNKYMTLREFLKETEDILYPNAWCARVSTKEGYQLKHKQDFIESWFPPKKIDELTNDSAKKGYDILNPDNDGETCILKREIHLGVIGSDTIDWLNNCCGKQQRAELLDNLMVKCAIIYPATHKVNTLDEVIEAQKKFNGENTFQIDSVNGKLTEVRKEQKAYAWCLAPMSELVTELKKLRKQYDKHNPDEFPLNNAYKTILNTIYGDIVSPYFPLSNVVVGNNTTARARLKAWLIEKCLNTFQTITDGGQFDLDQVITHGKRKVTAESVVENQGLKNKNIKYTSIEGNNEYQIAENAIEHIKSIFPDLEIMKNDVYSLELKVIDISEGVSEYIAKGIATHGSANYSLRYSQPKNKMRGWNDNLYTIEAEQLNQIDSFLESLYNTPNAVNRHQPSLESFILKTKDYKQNYESYKEREIWLGDNVVKTRQMSELSLSTFTFHTKQQREKWHKSIEKLKVNTSDQHNLNYGQSLEMFYLNDDGSVNYQKMINELWQDIEDGLDKPRCLSNKSRNQHRLYQSHPYIEKRRFYKNYERIQAGDTRIDSV